MAYMYVYFISTLPSADDVFEFCTRNSTEDENEKLKTCDSCTVKVMLPPDSVLE